MTKRFVPGQRVKSLPGETLNRAIDAAERIQELLPPGGPEPRPRPTDAPRLVVLVRNQTGVNLKERSIVGIKSTTLTLPEITSGAAGDRANAAVLMGEAVDVELPDADKHTAGRWGVTLAPLKSGAVGYMAVAGLVKVRIDQLDEAHKFVAVKTNESDYVVSADSGTPITWRKLADETGEDAEGMQWGQINLGSGGGIRGNVIYAQVNEGAGVGSGDATFNFDNAVALVGSIPEGGIGTAQNQYAQTYNDNEWVILSQRQDNEQWLTERGGTAGSQVIWAELIEDKAYADVAKLAKPVLANGTLDSGADDFYLIDQEGRYFGLAAFDDTANGGAAVNGYRFHGVRISDDWESSGKPAFRIIDGEDPDDFILVQIDALATGSEYSCTYSGELPGGPDSARRPRYTESGAGLRVFDDFALVPAFTAGDYWICKWVKESAHYAFWRPLTIQDKEIWTLDPAGGHTLATISATTLQLNLKIRKLKLRIFEVREDVADDVEILYEDGVECPTE